MQKRWSARFAKKMEGLGARLEERKKDRLAKSIYQKELKIRRAAGAELRSYNIDRMTHQEVKNKKIS